MPDMACEKTCCSYRWRSRWRLLARVGIVKLSKKATSWRASLGEQCLGEQQRSERFLLRSHRSCWRAPTIQSEEVRSQVERFACCPKMPPCQHELEIHDETERRTSTHHRQNRLGRQPRRHGRCLRTRAHPRPSSNDERADRATRKTGRTTQPQAVIEGSSWGPKISHDL